MVQLSAVSDYDHEYDPDMEENQKEPPGQWTEVLRAAAQDFVKTIGESYQRLNEATEKFSADSMAMLQDLVARAEQAAASSSEKAAAAEGAAAQARQAGETLDQMLAEAGEQFQA